MAREVHGVVVGAALAGLVALVVAPWLPWMLNVPGWQQPFPAGASVRRTGEVVAVLCVLPTALFGLLTLGRRSVVLARWALGAAVLGSGGVLTSVLDSSPLSAADWPGIGLGLALFGYPLTVLGVAGATVGWHDRRRGVFGMSRRQRLVGLVALVFFAAGIGYGGYWYAVARVVDAGTGSVTASSPVTAPAGTVVWRAQDRGLVPTDTGLLVLRERSGVSVLDVNSGVERWHYRRYAGQVVAASVSTDGHTVLVVYDGHDRDIALGLDATNGGVRWWRQLPEYSEVWALPTGVLTQSHSSSERLRATQLIDPASGRPAWSARMDEICQDERRPPQSADGFTILLSPCGVDPAIADLTAIDAKGQVRWRASAPAKPGQSLAGEECALLSAADDVVIMRYAYDRDVELATLDAKTGRLLSVMPDNGGGDVMAVGEQGLLIEGNGTHGMTLRDVVSGAPRAGQPPTGLEGVTEHAGAIRDGNVYLATSPAPDTLHLVILDLSSGRQLGDYPLNAPNTPVRQTVGVSTGSGVAVVGPDDGTETIRVSIGDR